ncbi:hypothetical protein V9T40_005125 [Parthenolecanium corni]|uniref:Uncharacterized protein n=1 Tax=Parthenolecanium corni TaxID=536013 RepID=A0AAN9Y2S4_9HEMI
MLKFQLTKSPRESMRSNGAIHQRKFVSGYHHLPPIKGGGGVGLRVTRTSGGYPYNLRNGSPPGNMTKATVTANNGNFMPMKSSVANATKTNSSGPRTR